MSSVSDNNITETRKRNKKILLHEGKEKTFDAKMIVRAFIAKKERKFYMKWR